ncbi:MAG: phosphocholine cytidylyltransferase family protein, partial [Betaproteobacteria bacterium]
AAGIEDITAVTGYRGEMIAERGLPTISNERWQQTNMATSLFCAALQLQQGNWLVAYSDIVYHPDIPLALLDSQYDIAVAYDTMWLALWRQRFDDPATDAESFRVEHARIVDIGRRGVPLESIQGQYLGLFRLSARGFEQLHDVWMDAQPAERDRMDMTSLLARALVAGVAIGAVPTAGRWCEVDSDHDLALYETLAQAAPVRAWKHDWRWLESSGCGA